MLGIRKALTKDISQELDTLGRQIDAEGRRFDEEIDLFKRQMVRIAQGQHLDEGAILGGRLYNEIPSGTLKAFIDGQPSPLVLDVRTPSEWGSGHIPGAIHIPIDQLQGRIEEVEAALEGDKARSVVAYCAAGARSAAACDILAGQGFLSLHNAAGGLGSYKGKLDT